MRARGQREGESEDIAHTLPSRPLELVPRILTPALVLPFTLTLHPYPHLSTTVQPHPEPDLPHTYPPHTHTHTHTYTHTHKLGKPPVYAKLQKKTETLI